MAWEPHQVTFVPTFPRLSSPGLAAGWEQDCSERNESETKEEASLTPVPTCHPRPSWKTVDSTPRKGLQERGLPVCRPLGLGEDSLYLSFSKHLPHSPAPEEQRQGEGTAVTTASWPSPELGAQCHLHRPPPSGTANAHRGCSAYRPLTFLGDWVPSGVDGGRILCLRQGDPAAEGKQCGFKSQPAPRGNPDSPRI